MALRGWSQIDLAEEAGISQPTVSTALRGELVSARTVKAINEAIERVRPPSGMNDLVVAS
jgi:transcriptional regulator with XRE-family HTH domain